MNPQPNDVPWKESRFHNSNAQEQEDDEENDDMFAMFADPDPTDVFKFEFSPSLKIELAGQKQENGQLLHSTGLTLWRASELLCQYLLDHKEVVRGKRVLEVSKSLLRDTFFVENHPRGGHLKKTCSFLCSFYKISWGPVWDCVEFWRTNSRQTRSI
jgi:hypothetical protein